MGKITILSYTTKDPLQLIGMCSGICWDSPINDKEKNIDRAIECALSNHGRTLEFPDVYMTLDGYSARVIREWYTHIGGMPTRLQSSTRYVNAENFKFVTPNKIIGNTKASEKYNECMKTIADTYADLINLGVKKEDAAMILPLGMETKVVDKRNLRNLIDMSRNRMCSRAYAEFRELFNDIINALSDYSDEWKYLVNNFMMSKCDVVGYCTESKSCGRHEKITRSHSEEERAKFIR